MSVTEAFGPVAERGRLAQERITDILMKAPRLERARVLRAPKLSTRAEELLEAIAELRAVAREPLVRSSLLAVDLLDRLLDLERMVFEDPDLADPRWRIRRVAIEVRDLLRAIVEQVELHALDDPAKAAHFVVEHLAGVGQERVARLLGVDPRTLRAWKSAEPSEIRKDPERIRLVAHVVHLLGSLPPWSIVSWFERPRSELQGRSPSDLIDAEPRAAAGPVLELARSALGQLAT